MVYSALRYKLVAFLVVFALAFIFVPNASAAVPPVPSYRSIPNPMFGVTIDDVYKISSVVSTEKTLPYMPTTRVVFDEGVNASYYLGPVQQLRSSSYVLGEILDSEGLSNITLDKYKARTQQYLNTLGGNVDVWEIGNEVNGNWTGSYSSVSSKIQAAHNLVKAAGGKTYLTLWENSYTRDNCGNGTSELTPVQFSKQYVPQAMRESLDYVGLSFYPTLCQGAMTNGKVNVSAATVKAEVEQLHALYPNAKIGFSEIGLPNRATSTNLTKAKNVMNWGYSLDIDLPYYNGGYFWWYAYQDCFTGSKLLLNDLKLAFQSEANALGVPTP